MPRNLQDGFEGTFFSQTVFDEAIEAEKTGRLNGLEYDRCKANGAKSISPLGGIEPYKPSAIFSVEALPDGSFLPSTKWVGKKTKQVSDLEEIGVQGKKSMVCCWMKFWKTISPISKKPCHFVRSVVRIYSQNLTPKNRQIVIGPGKTN